MQKKQETADDIIAEMRGARTEFPFVYLMGEPDTPEVIDLRTKEITEPRKINIRRVTVKELADRFEAALKRECGDCAKLREALATIRKRLVAPYLSEADFMRYSHNKPLVDLIDAALAAPPRNCDVGTAEEQSKRYEDFCESLHKETGTCDTCPICKGEYGKAGNLTHCQFVWAQMPYVEKEGGAK